MFSKKLGCLITVSALAVGAFVSPIASINGGSTNATVHAATTSDLTVSDMPSYLKSSVEWVWNNRILKENSTSRENLIFDQIYDGEGTLNYVVRWQSSQNLSLATRQKMEEMLSRQINNWTQYLSGYDGWPFDHIDVKIVGWAVPNASQILDKQSYENVYTDCTYDSLSEGTSIPSQLPNAPSSISRFDHFQDSSYQYPGGYENRFDMYLWGTTGFSGGAGGDWGQRISDDYILSTLDYDEVHIIEHEMGHGFGLPDFYEEADRPTGGFPTHTIMWAGDSATITDWDVWMLRYTWSQLKQDTNRFPAITVTTPSPSPEVTVTPSPETTVTPTPETSKDPVVSTGDVQVSLDVQSSSETSTNAITKTFLLKNTGTADMDLSKVKIRYYFTKDSDQGLQMWCDNAAISYTQAPWYTAVTSNLVGTFGSISADMADSYVDISFNGTESIMTSQSTLTAGVRIAKEDWSLFNQANDYSNLSASNVVVYYDGAVIWGNTL